MSYDDKLIAGRMKVSGNKVVIIDFSYFEAMMTSLEKSEYRVLLFIISESKLKKTTPIKIKKRKLADKLDLSAPGVIKALRGLEDKGFIEEVTESCYCLRLPPDDDDDDDDDEIWDLLNGN